jgi:hypothetical protein
MHEHDVGLNVSTAGSACRDVMFGLIVLVTLMLNNP